MHHARSLLGECVIEVLCTFVVDLHRMIGDVGTTSGVNASSTSSVGRECHKDVVSIRNRFPWNDGCHM